VAVRDGAVSDVLSLAGKPTLFPHIARQVSQQRLVKPGILETTIEGYGLEHSGLDF
jgi:hypothetical protein